MSLRNLLIRADASAEIGVGHVMRCIALAQAWQKAGGQAIFALATGARELGQRIRSHGWEVRTLPCTPGSEADAAKTLDLGRQCAAEWIVLDGYQFSPDYARALNLTRPRLLIIADGEQPPELDCDILVNPDPLSDTSHGRSNKRTEFLLGARFALLREEFLQSPRVDDRCPKIATRILVTLGGGDAHNVTGRVLQALGDLADLELSLTVIVGPSNPHLALLQAIVENSPHTVRLFTDAPDMPVLMAQAEMAVTAGGGTCYELAFNEGAYVSHHHGEKSEPPCSSSTCYRRLY